MNNKGFTLIELLAVILILSLLALLANTSVTKVVRDSKAELYDSQLKMIEIAAETWGSENIDKLPDSGQCKYFTLGDLKSYGLLDSSVKNPKTDKEFSNDLNIKILATENKYGKTNITYEVDPDNINGCEKAFSSSICTLASDSTVSVGLEGAKYNCKVDPNKPEYTFYLVDNNEDGTSDLIMNANINATGEAVIPGVTVDTGLTKWTEKDTDGPMTAMTYLYNATKNWINLEPLNYEYHNKETWCNQFSDCNSSDYFENYYASYPYETLIIKNGILEITDYYGNSMGYLGTKENPVRTRLAIYIPNDDSSEIDNTLPEYLLENLTDYSSNPIGYWLLTSAYGHRGYGTAVEYSYGISDDPNTFNGVRPVITVKL